MKIVGSLVPPIHFRRFRWVVPVDVPHPSRWHYGVPLPVMHQGGNNVDPETIDAPLRDLVGGLHRMGLRTTPSCAGHFGVDGDRVVQAAKDMANEERWIRRIGLRVKDIESGDEDVVQDPSWRAPDVKSLTRDALRWEGVGYLGVVCPRRLLPPRTVQMPWVEIVPIVEEYESRIDIWVRSPNKELQHQTWRNTKKHLLHFLGTRQ